MRFICDLLRWYCSPAQFLDEMQIKFLTALCDDEEEEDSRQKGRGGKLPAKRDQNKGDLVSPQSDKASPGAGDERRPKHSGDDVGGTALPIPSKSLNAENPGMAAWNGTASSRSFNTPGVKPLYASHLQGSSMADVDAGCHLQMNEFQKEREVGMVVRK